MSRYNFDNAKCEYGDCEATGIYLNEHLEAWLCEDHTDSPDDSTGYCNRECQLGHGCDGSC